MTRAQGWRRRWHSNWRKRGEKRGEKKRQENWSNTRKESCRKKLLLQKVDEKIILSATGLSKRI